MADLEVDHAAVLGYFSPFNLYISVRDGVEALRPVSELKGSMSDDELLGHALARLTYMHEIRHFHDYFGTIAGISLFHTHFRQVRAFAQFIEVLRASGRSLTLPLDGLLHSDDPFAGIGKALVRNWQVMLRSTATFTQAFEKTIEPGRYPDDHVIYKSRGEDLPEASMFPFSFAINSGDTQTDMTLCYPIGLEALLEGNAQAMQRGAIEWEYSSEFAAKLVPSILTPPSPSVDPREYVKTHILPYNVTDLLVSKFLRLRGHPKFERNTILQITDFALSFSHILAKSEPWEVPPKFELADVGRLFVDTLESSEISDLVAGTVPCADDLTRIYEKMLSDILETTKPEDILYKADLLTPLDMVEAIVNHHIIAPLIKARLKSNHEVFQSTAKYLELLPTLPGTPMLLIDGKASYANYMKLDTMGDAWTKYCLIAKAMNDTYTQNGTLHCFRSNEIRDSDLNLCLKGGSCVGNIASGQCEEWLPSLPLPNCLFATLVKRFGFKL